MTKWFRALLFFAAAGILLLIAFRDWQVYRRFQSEPVAETQAVSGSSYTEKTSRWLFKSYRTSLYYNIGGLQPSVMLNDEPITEAQLTQLQAGQTLPLRYLVNEPEIASHEGRPRDRLPWQMPAWAAALILAGLLSLRQKPAAKPQA